MNILQFLIYWSVRVVEWFGQLYDVARDYIIHFSNYLYYAASIAVSQIVSAVSDLIHDVKSYALSAAQYLYDRAIAYINQFLEWVKWTIEQAKQFALAVIYGVRDYLYSLYLQALQLIEKLTPFFNGLIEAAKQFLITYLLATFGWLLPLYQFIMGLLNIFNPTNIAKFLDFLQNLYPILLQFVQNPVGFILDMLLDFFIPFFCYVVAKGLGTTIYDLPPKPIWKK